MERGPRPARGLHWGIHRSSSRSRSELQFLSSENLSSEDSTTNWEFSGSIPPPNGCSNSRDSWARTVRLPFPSPLIPHTDHSANTHTHKPVGVRVSARWFLSSWAASVCRRPKCRRQKPAEKLLTLSALDSFCYRARVWEKQGVMSFMWSWRMWSQGTLLSGYDGLLSGGGLLEE